MAQLTGEQIIARSLKTQGIDKIFGVVGIPVTGIASACQAEGLTYTGMRHEMPATYAAQAVSFIGGRMGAALAVSVVEGEGLFRELVQSLAQILGVDIAFIALPAQARERTGQTHGLLLLSLEPDGPAAQDCTPPPAYSLPSTPENEPAESPDLPCPHPPPRPPAKPSPAPSIPGH